MTLRYNHMQYNVINRIIFILKALKVRQLIICRTSIDMSYACKVAILWLIFQRYLCLFSSRTKTPTFNQLKSNLQDIILLSLWYIPSIFVLLLKCILLNYMHFIYLWLVNDLFYSLFINKVFWNKLFSVVSFCAVI